MSLGSTMEVDELAWCRGERADVAMGSSPVAAMTATTGRETMTIESGGVN